MTLGGGFGAPVLDALLGTLAGVGSCAEPPDTVPLRILGLPVMSASAAEVRSAFRARLLAVHPDVAAYPGTPWLQAAADARAQARPEAAELTWARDVLLRKIPPPVTATSVRGAGNGSRNGYEPARCKGCGGIHRLHGGTVPGFHLVGRHAGYCYRCAADADNERQRDRRRQARAGRPCDGCGQPFTPPRADGRYCSPACRQRAYRRRQAAPRLGS